MELNPTREITLPITGITCKVSLSYNEYLEARKLMKTEGNWEVELVRKMVKSCDYKEKTVSEILDELNVEDMVFLVKEATGMLNPEKRFLATRENTKDVSSDAKENPEISKD